MLNLVEQDDARLESDSCTTTFSATFALQSYRSVLPCYIVAADMSLDNPSCSLPYPLLAHDAAGTMRAMIAKTLRSARLEALAVDNGWSRLVVLLL